MNKKVMIRALLGFPLGIFLSYTITIMISVLLARGTYSPTVPEFTTLMNSELGAVVLQYILSGILGAGLAASSVIWEIEDWSIFKRTVAHLIAMSVFMFPIAYFTYWMPHTFWGVLTYFLIFIALYAIIWALQFFGYRSSVRGINQKLQQR